MRILVSFNVTPDYEALPPSSWEGAQAPETRYVRRVLNCFDESALELALRLRDALAARGEALQLEALTIGGRAAEPYCKTLLALGYVRVTRVAPGSVRCDGDADAAADGPDLAPELTARLTAAVAREIDDVDALLLGCRGGADDGDTVPYLVAEALGWPCLPEVVEVEVAASGALRVTSTLDDALARVTLRAPCVLAVGNAVVSHLRVPTLKERLALGERGSREVTAAALGVQAAGEQLSVPAAFVGLEPVDRSRDGVVVEGETPREKARVVYERYLAPRLERLRAGGAGS